MFNGFSKQLCHFLIDFDKNKHEGLSSVGELESVLILKNLFCTVGQKLIFWVF